jgi:hypothetical protein
MAHELPARETRIQEHHVTDAQIGLDEVASSGRAIRLCGRGCVTQMRRRRPRPGVTAAATTAVLATGARPGVTALATTAVLATGRPTTPRRPRRAALIGMSGSFIACVFIGLD